MSEPEDLLANLDPEQRAHEAAIVCGRAIRAVAAGVEFGDRRHVELARGERAVRLAPRNELTSIIEANRGQELAVDDHLAVLGLLVAVDLAGLQQVSSAADRAVAEFGQDLAVDPAEFDQLVTDLARQLGCVEVGVGDQDALAAFQQVSEVATNGGGRGIRAAGTPACPPAPRGSGTAR